MKWSGVRMTDGRQNTVPQTACLEGKSTLAKRQQPQNRYDEADGEAGKEYCQRL